MTTPTYEIADFQELKDYIEYPIKEFVDLINYVVDDEAQDELCDFYIVMNHLRNVNKPVFDYVFNFFVNTENNTLSLYIFLKFLLLDEEEQTQFVSKYFTQNQLLIDLHNRNIRELPVQDFLKEVFEFAEDDYLNNFLDYQDNYLQYRPLNIKNIKKINNANINYMDKQFIKRFVLNIRIIIRCKVVHKLIYLISSKNKTQTLREGETSITTYEDYIRRFENNIDDFMELYHYFMGNLKLIYSTEHQRVRQWIQQFSKDILLVKKEDKYDRVKEVLYKIIDIDYSCYTSNITFNGYLEISPYFINNFLLIKYDYNCNTQDDYKLFSTIQFNKIHSDILHKRYKGYFKSVLYSSLVLISDVHINLAEIVKMSEDKNIMEFEQFLEKIFETYHFERHFKY